MDLQAYAHLGELPASAATRVARLLEIDGPETVSDVQLARHIADGLFPHAAMALSEVLGRNRIVGPVVPGGDVQASAQGREDAVQGP